MKEKIIIAFIATLTGLLFTTLAFYFYQNAKPLKTSLPKKTVGEIAKTQERQVSLTNPSSEFFLELESPKDEAIVNTRTIELKGKTNVGATVVISSALEDVVTTPDGNGDFLQSINIETGPNIITTSSLLPNGNILKDERVLTFTTEEF